MKNTAEENNWTFEIGSNRRVGKKYTKRSFIISDLHHIH
jgi:hypothetical protein